MLGSVVDVAFGVGVAAACIDALGGCERSAPVGDGEAATAEQPPTTLATATATTQALSWPNLGP